MLLLLKNLLFTLVFPATAGVYVPLWIARNRAPASGALFVVAVALLAVGGVTYGWCVWEFASYGRGTPLPLDAPKMLVIRGLYRYVRNPMYVGVLTVILGWAVMFRTWTLVVYALCAWAVFHTFIVVYEERHLRRIFGRQYEDYRSRVGRWVPGRGGSS